MEQCHLDRIIRNMYKIVEEPYLKAWRQDFVCTLAKLKGFDLQIMEMAERYEHIAAELFDAIQNETLDGFIGFNYEEIKKSEYVEKLKKDNERLQQLIEMLQTVKRNLELPAEESKMDVDDFISYLNKLYKKKSKYIQIQKDDIKKLEKYRELKKLEKIISENAKENKDRLIKVFSDIREEEDNQNKKNLNIIDYKGAKIIIRKNDLTEEMTEAIVNPTKDDLKHEEGCAKEIADKAGDKFTQECKEYKNK